MKDINPDDKKTLKFCEKTAAKLVDKDFESTIGSMNSYLNKNKSEKTAVDTWGKECKKKIGSHHFGYLREHDPKYVIPGTMTPVAKAKKRQPSRNASSSIAKTTPQKAAKPHLAAKAPKYVIVKPKDTLSSIAKRNGTTVQKLFELNGAINPKNLKIG